MMTPEERQAALDRLNEYADQVDRAEHDADKGSLERGRDLTLLYEDAEWWQPRIDPPLNKVLLGEPIDPFSKSRFISKWMVADPKREWQGYTHLKRSTCQQLMKADATIGLYKIGRQVAASLSGERAVRPVYRLAKYGIEESTKDALTRAQQLARDEGSQEITSKHTKHAVKELIAELTPAQRHSAVGRKKSEVDYTRAQMYFEHLIDDGELGKAHEFLAWAVKLAQEYKRPADQTPRLEIVA